MNRRRLLKALAPAVAGTVLARCGGVVRGSRPSDAPPRKAKPAQQAILDAFARHTVRQKAVLDADGNVVRLAISNHAAFWKQKPAPPPEPMPEALFRNGIVQLPHLEAVAIEKQNLADAAYALLGGLKRLRDVRLHYLRRDAGATRDAPRFVNRLPLPLEVLEIKHCFSIRGGCMDRLKPQPDLRKLEIDTGYAGPEAVGFIEGAPKLVNLQMHRTTVSDGGLQRVFAALPDLEVLLVRPSGPRKRADRITGRSLRGLARCPKVRLLVLGIAWGDFPWEDGLEVLAGLERLEQGDFAPTDIRGFSLDYPTVRRLHRARPDLLLRFKCLSVGGTDGRKPLQEDAAWNWDDGVTTHG